VREIPAAEALNRAELADGEEAEALAELAIKRFVR
jgi:hypothetical protein